MRSSFSSWRQSSPGALGEGASPERHPPGRIRTSATSPLQSWAVRRGRERMRSSAKARLPRCGNQASRAAGHVMGAEQGSRDVRSSASSAGQGALPPHAWSGRPGVDAVVTALVLAGSRRSVSASNHDRTDPSAARSVRAYGESEVRGAARAETRFHLRTAITSVVPWLVVSDSSSGCARWQLPFMAAQHGMGNAARWAWPPSA
jgi:hypothetical protein